MSSAKRKSKTIKIKYFRSAIGSRHDHRLILRGLGLRKLNQVVERPDSPSIRHMVDKISYLVQIVESK